MRPTLPALLFLVATMPALALAQEPTERVVVVAAPAPVSEACAAHLSSERIRTALATLDGILNDPAPSAITPAAAREYQQHTEWLSSVRNRLGAHLTDRDAALRATSRNAESADVQRMAAMNMQFLALQDAVQMESRKFQTLSNASSARHEVAMNAIRNMKA